MNPNTIIYIVLAIDLALVIWWSYLVDNWLHKSKKLYWQDIVGIIFMYLVFFYIGLQMFRTLLS